VSSSPFLYQRVGVIVPKYGRTAVERNRLKRRLREAVRAILLPLGGNRDVVIWAQPPAYKLGMEDLTSTLRRLVERMSERQVAEF
jgi:ribonuclease P protein component